MKKKEERAGGIVFRMNDKQPEYLLVTSNSNKSRWIFPAGHVELNETKEAAALREVLEEAGIRGEIILPLASFNHFWERNGTGININTQLYLMRFIEKVTDNTEGRQRQFYNYEAALKLNMWEESKLLLQKSHQLVMNQKL